MSGSIIFHCFTVDFILKSLPFACIDIVLLQNMEKVLHRPVLFLFTRQKAVLLLQQISQ